MRTPVVYPPCGGGSDASGNQGLKTGAYHDVAVGKEATSREIVLGSDPRLSDARKASDVAPWAKEKNKPTYTSAEVGAAEKEHEHDLATATKPGFMAPADKIAIAGLPALAESIRKAIDDMSLTFVQKDDPRLSDAREASDVNDWAKAPKKPKYTAEEVGAAESCHTHKPATTNCAGFMSAEDKRLLISLASRTGAVSKAKNNEIKELTDGLFVKTPSWTNKEW